MKLSAASAGAAANPVAARAAATTSERMRVDMRFLQEMARVRLTPLLRALARRRLMEGF
jgi:hypothetical protein